MDIDTASGRRRVKPVLDQYRMFALKSFVNENKYVRWCPEAGCENAIECKEPGAHAVECSCGNLFCFGCGEETHAPTSCASVEEWNIKNSAESENVTWILANTKACPKCKVSIQKNQGCNHMTCNKNAGGCGYDFCWMCLGDWKSHGSATGGYYECNKYKKDKAEGKLNDEERRRSTAKEALDKYMHYFERFQNNHKSIDYARKMVHDMGKKQEVLRDMSSVSLSLDECSFLREAAAEVVKCRRVLKWTYVHGYYLEDEREKNLFEFMQEDLEKHTEHLHELVEVELEAYLQDAKRGKGKVAHQSTDRVKKKPFLEYRKEVTSYAATCRKYRRSFVDATADDGVAASQGVAGLGGGGGGGETDRRCVPACVAG